MNPQFYSTQGAADFLNISTRTLRRAVRAKELPVIAYNARTWRFTATDLAVWYAKKGGKLKMSATRASEHTNTKR